jgi:hypothetical protein
MSSLTITGDTSGSVILSAPAAAGSNTISLPTLGGTMMASGSMPAFSAYRSSNVNLSNSTWTKIAFDTEFFDTNNNFDSSTNYRFTPTVAGYYQINASITSGASNNNAYWNQIAIYKNGTPYIYSSPVFPAGNIQNYGSQLSQLISMNGSTDYIEIYINVYVASGTPSYAGGSNATLVSGYLARAA